MEHARVVLVDYDKASRQHASYVVEMSGHIVVKEAAEPTELANSLRHIITGKLDVDLILCSTDSVNKESAQIIQNLGSQTVFYDPSTVNIEKLAAKDRKDILYAMGELEKLPNIA